MKYITTIRISTILLYISLFLTQTIFAQCWDTIYWKHPNFPNPSDPRVFFHNEKIGWLVNDSLYKTTDGGDTWIGQPLYFGPFYETAPRKITFSNILVGYLIFQNTVGTYIRNVDLWVTKDGGKNWTKKSILPRDSSIEYISRAEALNGDKLLISARIRKSGVEVLYLVEKYGDTWKEIYNTNYAVQVNRFGDQIEDALFWMSKDGFGYANSYINNQHYLDTPFVQLHNFGLEKKYITKTKHFNINPLISIHKNKIWALNQDDFNMMLSVDSGKTWKVLLKQDSMRYYMGRLGYFTDSLHGVFQYINEKNDDYAGYKTTKDGGQTWRTERIKISFWDTWGGQVMYPNKDFIYVIYYNRNYMHRYRRPAPPQCDAIKITDTLKVGEPLKWGAASGCIGGYVLRIGTTPDGGDLIDSLDLWDKTEWMPNIALPFGKPIYVSIRPYNDGDFAPPCPSVVLPTQSCTLETRIDTLIKLGGSYKGFVYQKDTTLIESYKSKLGCDSLVKIVIDITTSNQEIWASTQPSMKIQPNPATDILQIEVKNIPTNQQASLTLYDMTGRAIQQLEVEHTHYSGTMNLGTIPGGIYLLKLESDHRVLVSERVVVIR